MAGCTNDQLMSIRLLLYSIVWPSDLSCLMHNPTGTPHCQSPDPVHSISTADIALDNSRKAPDPPQYVWGRKGEVSQILLCVNSSLG